MEHRKGQREKIVKELHVDYWFMGCKGETATRCIVVAKDFHSKSVMSSVVPLKKACHEYPARRITALMKELGLEAHDLVLTSDQEAALQDLLNLIGRKRILAKTFYELSPVGSSASSGVAERGANSGGTDHSAQGRFGNTRGCDRGEQPQHFVAGTLVNKYGVGHGGSSPYERLRGKSSRLLGLEFGELVNFRRTPAGNRLAKLDSLWKVVK